MNKNLKFYGPMVLALLIIIGWAVFFYFVSPTVIVDKIGLKNAYIIAFVLAVICGFSSLTATTFYVVVAALANGGANWFLLGLSGGIGLCISDFAFYYVTGKARQLLIRTGKRLQIL